MTNGQNGSKENSNLYKSYFNLSRLIRTLSIVNGRCKIEMNDIEAANDSVRFA